MKIEARVVGDVVVLSLSGPIVIGVYDKFQWAVGDFLQGDRKKILLHLGDVPYVDDSGLMAMVNAHKLASKNGARLKLSNPSRKLQDLFAVTKLLTVFDTYKSEELAIQSFDLPF